MIEAKMLYMYRDVETREEQVSPLQGASREHPGKGTMLNCATLSVAGCSRFESFAFASCACVCAFVNGRMRPCSRMCACVHVFAEPASDEFEFEFSFAFLSCSSM